MPPPRTQVSALQHFETALKSDKSGASVPGQVLEHISLLTRTWQSAGRRRGRAKQALLSLVISLPHALPPASPPSLVTSLPHDLPPASPPSPMTSLLQHVTGLR